MDPFASFNGFNPTPAANNPFGIVQQQQSQEQASVASGNPYGTYNNTQSPPQQQPMAGYNGVQQQQQQTQQQTQPYAQQAMVPTAQQPQTNQWSMQGMQHQQSFNSTSLQGGYPQQSPPQVNQQQHMMTPSPQQQLRHTNSMVPSSAQSIGSSNYMTPHMAPHSVVSSHGSNMMSPGVPNQMQQQPYANAYQNTYIQQQQHNSPPAAATSVAATPTQMAPAPASVPVPVPAPVPATVDEDEDFFGDLFSNSVKQKQKQTISPHRPPTELDVDYHESISVLSKSTNGTERYSTTLSPLDNPRFAPKPPKPQGLDNARALAHNAPAGASQLPDYDLVTHSGYALSRISFRTILIKKWKQVFWVVYGVNRLLVFRSSADFEDWVSNPYLNTAQREFLVKLEIDLVADIGKQNVRGYQVTNQRLKNYNNQMLYQFKIERWMDYGPTIAAAFGSQNEREIYNLRTIFNEMLKRSPQDQAALRGSNQRRPNHHALPNSFSGPPGNQPPAQRYNYSSSASAGMASTHSMKSHGVLSTGPVERRRSRPDPSGDAVAGYQPSSHRRPFQY